MATLHQDDNFEARSLSEDDSLADSDSGYWAAGESTRSVTSSIYNYETVHGRTYHAYHQGKYKMPNDKDEQQRIEIKYHAIRLALNNTLFFAPIRAPSCILDIGTGTGLWAIDVADAHPQASVVGIDLSPIMTNLVPPNLEFQIHDADEPWDFTRKFDLVHCRIMNDFTLRSWPFYFQQAYNSMLPGGWVECQEFDYHRQSDDDSIPEDSKLTLWEREWTRGIQKIGLQGACKPDLVMQQMRDVGFINVETRLFK
jgi:cyclopropane fatty-acyl-phospholipid synthase-like methyltransferase